MQGEATRPTADRVKESFFNIIAPRIVESKFTDIFSGTGSIGCEALSRGAKWVSFVDEEPKCVAIIEKNAQRVCLKENITIYCESYKSAVKKLEKQDIIFLDPPYNKGIGVQCLDLISKYDILESNGIAVLEHDSVEDIPEKIGNLKRFNSRKYGRAVLSFYEK